MSFLKRKNWSLIKITYTPWQLLLSLLFLLMQLVLFIAFLKYSFFENSQCGYNNCGNIEMMIATEEMENSNPNILCK